jgi:Lrp/AsnC family transcriptional regulator, leucine-responsive regulatory protein
MKLDAIDIQILDLLQQDGRMTHRAIAEAVGLSPASVHERVTKLEAGPDPVIQRYTAVVNPNAIRLPLTAFIRVMLTGNSSMEGRGRIAAMPSVLECHHVAGEDCLIIKVKVGIPADLAHVLEEIRQYVPVSRTVTNITISTEKETTYLPLPREQDL